MSSDLTISKTTAISNKSKNSETWTVWVQMGNKTSGQAPVKTECRLQMVISTTHLVGDTKAIRGNGCPTKDNTDHRRKVKFKARRLKAANPLRHLLPRSRV